MDEKIILWIIAWICIIASSIYTAKETKRKEAEKRKAISLSSPRDIAAEDIRSKRQQSVKSTIQQPTKAQNGNAFLPGEKAQDKWERVASRPRKSTPPMSPVAVSSNPLRDKQALRNAIIFGEVLAPKF